MDSNVKQEKTKQIRDILRMFFIEASTYKRITEIVGISRPTAKKYIDRFMELVSEEDFIIKDYYKDLKRRVPFPACWNKYVKIMIKDYAHHPKTITTPDMRKKIINAATPDDPTETIKTAMEAYKRLRKLKGKVPSYETVVKILREYHKKYKIPPID